MAEGDVQEIAPGIWCWERRPRGVRQGEFGARTSYAITMAQGTVLLDALVGGGDDDSVLPVLDRLVENSERVRILVSMPFHTRSSEFLWRRYRRMGARIYGHPDVAARLDDPSGFEAVTGGSEVDGLARFHSIGQPPRSEQPVEISARRVLAFGDAVVNIGDRDLRLWDAPLESAKRRRWWNERYLPTLEPLLDLQVDHVLVTHGRPVVRGGLTALRHALHSEPWQRPKRE